MILLWATTRLRQQGSTSWGTSLALPIRLLLLISSAIVFTHMLYPCGVCEKPVTNRHRALTCDQCDKWIHVTNCSDVSRHEYTKRVNLQEDLELGFVCKNCITPWVRSELPFSNVSVKDFDKLMKKDKVKVVERETENEFFPFQGVGSLSDFFEMRSEPRINSLSEMPFFDTPAPVFRTLNGATCVDVPLDVGFLPKRKVNTVSMNCQGFLSKLNEVSSLAEQNVSVFCLTESWLTSSHKTSELQIPGFTTLRNDKSPKQWGTLMLVNKSLKTKRVMNDEKNFPFDAVKFSGKAKFLLINIYRPCKSTSDWFCKFQTLLDKVTLEYPGLPTYFCGDFNIDSLSNSTDCKTLKSMFAEKGFVNTVTEPTRVCNSSSTCLDHFWTNDENVKTTRFLGISDHYGIATVLPSGTPKQGDETVTYRCFKAFNSEQFHEDASLVPWHSCLVFDDPTDQYAHFANLFGQLVNEHAPMKTVKIRQGIKKQPWMTSRLLSMIKTKNLLHLQSKTDSSLNLFYRDIRRAVKHELKDAKAKFFNDQIEENRGNSKKLWKILKTCCPFNENKSSRQLSQNEVNSINNHYCSVGKRISSKMSALSASFMPDIQTETPEFVFKSCTAVDIEKLVSQLSTGKAAGFDDINAIFLKNAATTFSDVLSTVFDNCITSGKFPNELKVARVTPIYKSKGDPDDPDNYRPISVLPVFSKIFERFLANQLVDHIENNRLLNLHQSGFRRKHSTDTALHHMVDTWTSNLSQKLCTAVLAIDLSKAFDCLKHDVILESLQNLGVNHDIFRNYLQYRSQFVSVGKVASDLSSLSVGVPQGSILGPLLFIIALHDIESVIDSSLHAFADDISTWKCGNHWGTLRQGLEVLGRNLQVYLAYKGLQVNVIKCNLIVIGRQNLTDVRSNDTLSINFLGKQIVERPEFKLLGVTIDNKLSFSSHVTNLLAKCQQNISFLWRTASSLDLKYRKLLANAIVNPHLDYCSSVFHLFLSKQDCQKIESMQYKLMRFVCATPRQEYTSAHVLRKNLNWDTAFIRRQSKLMKLTWSAVYSGTCPQYMNNLIGVNESYNTRFQTSSIRYFNKYSNCTLNHFYCSQFVKLPRLILNSETSDVFQRRFLTFCRT